MLRFLSIAPIFFATTVYAEPPQIVADIPPVQSLVAQVTGDVTTPDLILNGSEDPHHANLRPSQARAISNADIIVWIGPDLTPWMTKVVEASAADAIKIQLFDVPEIAHRTFIDGSTDPHAWLDPVYAAIWVETIADQLAAADPSNAETYQINAQKAVAGLNQLTDTLSQDLSGVQGKNVIMAHDAYGYYADRFGLSIAGTIADGEAVKPGAAQLKKMRELASSGEIACIFSEAAGDVAAVETVLDGTEIPTAVLDPIGVTLEPGPDLYDQLLTNMAIGIADCVKA